MKKILSLLLVLALMLSVCVVPVSAASPKVYAKMSDSYKSGPYYTKLMNVNLTGNQIEDLINVARSQVGYHASSSKSNLAGTATSGDGCVEYFNLISPNTMGNAWCATFVTWCFQEAGIPTSIMPSATGCGKIRNSVKNQGATYHSLESGYKPKKGDIVLYESMGGNYTYYKVAPRDANGLPSSTSHVGIVSGDYNEATNQFKTIQRKGSVVKEFNESMGTWGWNKDKTVKIKRIQGFVTPAYTGSAASKTPILTIYYNANGGVINSTEYSQNSSGRISKNGVDVTSVWEYGKGNPTYGLWNASSYSLTKSGYTCGGWSLSRDGSSTVFGQDDLALTAEKIYPNLKNGDASVTLYAVWRSNDSAANHTLTMYYNTNGGVIDSDEYSQTAYGRVQKDGKDVTSVWKYGTGNPTYGLWNASTYGLSKAGYKCVGWSLSSDGSSTVWGQDDLMMTAEMVYPDLKNGDASVTLYAIWAAEGEEANVPIGASEEEPFTDFDEDDEGSPDEELEEKSPDPEPMPASRSTIIMRIDDPLMTVNGKVTPVDELGNTPVIRNSRTMLPIASVMLAMDGTVGWDGSTKTVTLKRNGKTMFLRIGSGFAWDETGMTVANLDSPPIIINGRTMLPVAAIVLYFGADISWDGATRTVTITY